MAIIIETPVPPTRERLVLVPPEACTPVFDAGKPAGLSVRAQGARDATPADLERAGWVRGVRFATLKSRAKTADVALATRHARAMRAVQLAVKAWARARARSGIDEFRFADAERRLYAAQERLAKIEKEVCRG